MRKMKDSGIDWVGSIPEEWSATRLSRLTRSGRPITYGIVQCGPKLESGVPYIRPVDMEGSYIPDVSRLPKTSAEIARSYKRSEVVENDLVISIGPSFGKVGIVRGEHNGSNLTQGTSRFSPDVSRVHHRFSFWFLHSKSVVSFWDRYTQGATFQALNLEELRLTPVVLPPLPEQRDIVSFLDETTSLIDEIIEKKTKRVELLKELRSSVISEVVTKGLDSDVEMKDSGVEWIGKIPGHWENKKTTFSTVRIGSGTTPKTDNREYYDDGTVPWLVTGDLNDGLICSTSKFVTVRALEDHTTLRLYPKGSLVIAMYGATIGKLGLLDVECCVNQAGCVLQFTPDHFPKFWFYLLLFFRPHLIRMSYGGGQPNVSQNLIRSLRFWVPSYDEQRSISDFLDRESGRIDEQVRLEDRSIILLRELRQSLISEVVTGKIDVRKERGDEVH